MYSFKNSNLVCLVKQNHEPIFLKLSCQLLSTTSIYLFNAEVFSPMLCFPWFRNDACSRLMVHLFTNRFCAQSSKMPFNHVESWMKCFTAAVHNPQIQRNKRGISIFWGYLSSLRGTEDGTEAWGREEVLSCCFFGIVQKLAKNIYFIWMDSFQCLHGWSSLLLLWLVLEL